jgi:hypothetical protein
LLWWFDQLQAIFNTLRWTLCIIYVLLHSCTSICYMFVDIWFYRMLFCSKYIKKLDLQGVRPPPRHCKIEDLTQAKKTPEPLSHLYTRLTVPCECRAGATHCFPQLGQALTCALACGEARWFFKPIWKSVPTRNWTRDLGGATQALYHHSKGPFAFCSKYLILSSCYYTMLFSLQSFNALLHKLNKYVPRGSTVVDLYSGAGVIGLSIAASRKCR